MNTENNFDFELADTQSYNGELGADYSKKRTDFRVWQPFAESAEVRIYDRGEFVKSIPMRNIRGTWMCRGSGDLAGLEYDYLITRNGETVSSPDPYSREITEDGERSIIRKLKSDNPRNYNAQDYARQKISTEAPVIYELSVRDFSTDESANFVNSKSRGKFAAFCEEGITNSHGDTVGLEYIKSLGVTHIQLMPVFDFDLDGGAYNWGYNPRFYNVPCDCYSNGDPIRELKELIIAAHMKGIGVIADVVYNHQFSAEKSAFERIFPGYYFRQDKKGGYSNGSGCGNEFASERKMARKFIADSLAYLADEFKFDGFRFDLMGLLDIETMREIEQRLCGDHRKFLLYGEGWTGGESALPEKFRAVQQNASKLPGIAFFNDSFRDGIKGSVFDDTDCGYVNGAADEQHFAPIGQALTGEFKDFWTDNSSQTVNYVECHDNLTLFDKLTASMKGLDRAQIIKAGRMAAAFTLLSRGISFIQAGQEFLRSKNGEHNSYNLPDSINSIKWDLVTENRAEVEYYKGLIALRKRILGGLMWCRYLELDGGFVIYYKNKNGRYALVVNPTDEPITAEESLEYDIYADGEQTSETVIRKTEGLRCEAHSVVIAEVKQEIMKRLLELRRLMNERNISAYIVCTDDFHGSEYVGGYFKVREYLSGFTGSAGTLVVTPDLAALWTDGRYFIQAEKELSGSGIELMKMREKGTPTIAEFLAEKLPDGAVIGFDGRAVSAVFAEKLLKYLAYKNVTAKTDEDLGGMVWEKLDKRPELSHEPVFELPESVCGYSAAEKLEKIREKIKKERADCLVISALDQIAWTLNLRGNDIEYNPVFLCYMIISQNEVLLFADREIFSENIIAKLEEIGVKILGYSDIYNEEIWLYKRVWLDSGAVNFRLKNIIKRHSEIIDKKSPVLMMKAVKNSAEIEAIKLAHLIDGYAVTQFMIDLVSDITDHHYITELYAAEDLDRIRKYKSEEIERIGKLGSCRYLGQSFAPIMAYAEHGAIVHYSATEQTDVEIQQSGLLLFDTGAHYLGEKIAGTTDITRTLMAGPLTEDEKRAYTIVLAAHLELLNARFPRGTRGSTLDYAAREVLWKHGMDFNHGTGHGVGFLLNVHEGPQTISKNAVNDPPFEPGMIVSCEPGYYVEGKFGVRHESLMLCVEDKDHAGFLRFEPLTLVPFERHAIDLDLLTEKQVEYLNEYHALVYKKLSLVADYSTMQTLKAYTEPIKKTNRFIDEFGPMRLDPYKKTLVEVFSRFGSFFDRSGDIVTVPDGITTIGDMAFFGNFHIKQVILPESVKYIGKNAFRSCHSLAKINLENVISIGAWAFCGCDLLNGIAFGENLEEISEYAFDCDKIVNVSIPRSVKKLNANIFSNRIESIELYDSTDISEFDYGIKTGFGFLYESQRCTITMRSAESGGIKYKIVMVNALFPEYFNEKHELDFEMYDKAVLNTPKNMLAVIYRLKYPYKLTDSARRAYFEFISGHQDPMWEYLFENTDLELLEIIANNADSPVITRENIKKLINISVERKMPGITAFLLNYKHEKFPDMTDDLDLE